MKYAIGALLASLSWMLLAPGVLATSEDNQIIDAMDDYIAEQQNVTTQQLQEEFELKTFSSCEDMSSVLTDYLKNTFDESYFGYGRGGGSRGGFPMPIEGDAVAVDAPAANQDDAKTISREESQDGGGGGGDYSTTNVQVEGVDEADIIKNDGEYIYYYNQRQHEVAIIKSPVEGTTIDVDNAKVIKTINIPESFNALQMYVTNDRLIMLSQRWTNAVSQGYIDRSARMDVIVYDISDINDPALIKFSDMDGSYTDSRMIGDKLYVVSQLNVNWGFPWYMGLPMDKVMINADDMLPKTIDIAYTQDKADQNLTIGDTKFPYEISVQKPNCNEIFYVLPSKDSVQKFGITPSFSVVRVIDTDAVATSVKTKTAFGSTQTIHMSQDNLYLADPLYTSYAFSCPINARCMLPRYGGGEHTLIHKFALTAGDVDYKASTIVQGSPLSQYSMSEDDAGNFRILTTNRSPEVTTHFFVLNETLDLEGMLMNIEPGEQFKSSRYIGDKLYLVTFEQIDPLFVVDIATPKTPKIIGELKIPGYSTYLHPYAPLELGVQYLIGIGYDTTTNQWGGTQNGGIKVDLYKVDYNKKDAKGQVLVGQLWTKTFGDVGSESESLRNPRMFVWNANKKLLMLPMILQKPAGGEDCTIQYDAQGKEISRQCYPSYKQSTTFAGLKGITIDVQAGINELFSYDYTSYLKKVPSDYYQSREDHIDSWFFESLSFRVGYIDDMVFSINNLFAHFVVPGSDEEAYHIFDENVAEDKVPAFCTYTPPAPDEVTCDMYCGKRWVVEEGNCVEIEITASCGCPGVSTQELCEKECLQ